MDPLPIEVRGVERRYGRRRALHGLDLRVGPGEIVGLVGPNGSGKTSLLKILAGLIRPSAGAAHVFGLPPFLQRARIMERARFAFAPPALFESLTAREHLDHLGRIGTRAMSRVSRRDVDAALETVGLLARADDRVGTFSFGMRQRLALAQALLPMPELIVLDEPTDGLDPLAILELRGVLKRLRAEHGIAILLSSHLLVEVDELVDRLVVLHEGRALFSGRPGELCAGTERLLIAVDDPVRALGLLHERGLEARRNGDLEIELPPGSLELEDAIELFRRGSVALLGFHTGGETLEAALIARLRAASSSVGREAEER